MPRLQNQSDSSPTKDLRLRGKVAIIAGAGRGIGQAIAYRFAAEGAHLVLAARTVSELEAVATTVKCDGAAAHIVVADVRDRRQAAHVAQSSVDAFGGVDILVNVLGTHGPIGRAWEVDAEQWVEAFFTNLFGPFFLCQAVLPHMIRARRGKIISFSGGGAALPRPRFTAYGVSKAALVRLTETLAEELKELNIQVNAIAPGMVDTALQDSVLAAGELAGDELQRARRLRETGEGGTAREAAAELAVFLASDDSHHLTGRLVAAPFDGWESWDKDRIEEIMSQAWFTLRRMDPFTLRPLCEQMYARLAEEKRNLT